MFLLGKLILACFWVFFFFFFFNLGNSFVCPFGVKGGNEKQVFFFFFFLYLPVYSLFGNFNLREYQLLIKIYYIPYFFSYTNTHSHLKSLKILWYHYLLGLRLGRKIHFAIEKGALTFL